MKKKEQERSSRSLCSGNFSSNRVGTSISSPHNTEQTHWLVHLTVWRRHTHQSTSRYNLGTRHRRLSGFSHCRSENESGFVVWCSEVTSQGTHPADSALSTQPDSMALPPSLLRRSRWSQGEEFILWVLDAGSRAHQEFSKEASCSLGKMLGCHRD